MGLAKLYEAVDQQHDSGQFGQGWGWLLRHGRGGDGYVFFQTDGGANFTVPVGCVSECAQRGNGGKGVGSQRVAAPTTLVGQEIVDLVRHTELLAFLDDALQFVQQAVDVIFVRLAKNAANVGQFLEDAQRLAAEIDHVEMQLGWRVRHYQRCHERAQEGAFAGAGSPCYQHVASLARHIQQKRLLSLLGRAIDQAHREGEPAKRRRILLVARLHAPQVRAAKDLLQADALRQRLRPGTEQCGPQRRLIWLHLVDQHLLVGDLARADGLLFFYEQRGV